MRRFPRRRRTFLRENLSLVGEDPPGGRGYILSGEIRVLRADSRIVSFWDMDSSYVGGAHGSYYAHGVNFDPASGKRLALSDVVTDLEAVYQYVEGGREEPGRWKPLPGI